MSTSRVPSLQIPCLRILDLGDLVHDLAEPFEPGGTVLVLLHEVDEGVHRVREQPDGNDERGIVSEGDLLIVEEEAACDEDDDVEHVRDELRGGKELGHGHVGFP